MNELVDQSFFLERCDCRNRGILKNSAHRGFSGLQFTSTNFSTSSGILLFPRICMKSINRGNSALFLSSKSTTDEGAGFSIICKKLRFDQPLYGRPTNISVTFSASRLS